MTSHEIIASVQEKFGIRPEIRVTKVGRYVNTIAHEILVSEKAISLNGPQCDSSHQETMDAGIVKSSEKDTPRSVRVSNRKKSYHEESHLVKHTSCPYRHTDILHTLSYVERIHGLNLD